MAFPLYNVKFILLITFSFVTIFSSIAIYFCLPILISHVLRSQISLSELSGSFSNWRENQATDQIYLYNITNTEEILQFSESRLHGGAGAARGWPRLKLKQVGPITLRQFRDKLNIKFEPANETVLYDQRKSWSYLWDQSLVKSLDALNKLSIHHISVPLAGTTLNAEYAEFIQPIVTEFDLKLFLNHTLNELLFEGYHDILMESAKQSGQIDVERFGWLHNQNNSIIRNLRVFTGPSNRTLSKFGSVDQFNFKHQLDIWSEKDTTTNNMTTKNKCNDFRFSSAGEFYPPPENSVISHYNYQQPSQKDTDNHNRGPSLDIEPSGIADKSRSSPPTSNQKTIYLFMPDLCRSFRLYYNHSYNYKDSLKVDRYIATKYTYHYAQDDDNWPTFNRGHQDNPAVLKASIREQINSNQCFCIYNENTKLTSCPPNGMMDLYTCRKGSPLTVSFPHFYGSRLDPSLQQYLNLFEDDENTETQNEDYQFYIDLEQTLNMPVKVQIVIQFNVHFKFEPSLNFTRDYSFLFENPKRQQSKPVTDFYLPQMWIKSMAEVDESNLNNLKFIQKHLDIVTPVTTLAISIVAVILLSAAAKLVYDSTYGPRSRKSLSREQESCSSLSGNTSQYLEEKQKYYELQLLSSEKSQPTSSGPKSFDSCLNRDQPTTSKADDIATETQPLNR